MRIALSLLAVSLALPAAAGTLTIEKKGLVPVFVSVDGTDHGKVKKKKPLVLDVEDGTHEVWVAVERSGTVTSCHGLVDVGPAGATVVANGVQNCQGLRPGIPASGTAFRGASVLLNIDQDLDAWVSVDSGQRLALPGLTYELNLAVGQHTIVLYSSVTDAAVIDQGTVTIGRGESLRVTCTAGGCIGWDQPPVVVVVQENTPAPAAPGIQIDVNVPGVDVSISGTAGPPPAAPAPGGGSGEMYCCVNDDWYDCPDADALYTCTGAFMACQADCGMTDPDCMFRCAELIDPSDCSRNPSRDGECDD